MSRWNPDDVGFYPRDSFIASKELLWEYHRVMGKPYPGIVYGENCPPPPPGKLPETSKAQALEEP